ncbi:hypothetical protein GUITHDRAFT_99641 [Guillardia theta CCMP2712]|uniref:Uncharacterized protein n=1 Tax=Guillardia theta (strain CCMP2712) TaxID=905079 RepID=L1K315_GUITC|nr:hypothetical protein GUITHDRAFT_99641 [Guillardia theta CCMP2712]EKX54999.1 hypothetical protein GUITHDRAFT_99641 [Guillardia theta CCMP2712]|eukprot:XP_005841979.1 hypothetical protein GUITHDRAFT_99641 [Guillardia theta CCMP2712]
MNVLLLLALLRTSECWWAGQKAIVDKLGKQEFDVDAEELPPVVSDSEASIGNTSDEFTSTKSEEEHRQRILEREIDTKKVKHDAEEIIQQDKSYQETLRNLKEQEQTQKDKPTKVLKIDSIEALCSYRLSEVMGENAKLWEEVRDWRSTSEALRKMLEEEQKKSSQLASQLEVREEEMVMNQADTIKLLKVKNKNLASKVKECDCNLNAARKDL